MNIIEYLKRKREIRKMPNIENIAQCIIEKADIRDNESGETCHIQISPVKQDNDSIKGGLRKIMNEGNTIDEIKDYFASLQSTRGNNDW